MTEKGRTPSEVRRPSAIVFGSFDGLDHALLERALGVVGLRGLDADNAGPGGQCLNRQRGPGEQAAPPTGRQDQVEGPGLFDQLPGGRRLAGDHPPVVVRVDQGQPVPLDLFGHGRLARRERRLAGDDSRTVALGRRALHRRGRAGHHDADRNAKQLTGQRHRLCVVAGGVRDHPRRPLRVPELQQGVHRPPELERTDALEVLALQQHRAAGARVQGLRDWSTGVS